MFDPSLGTLTNKSTGIFSLDYIGILINTVDLDMYIEDKL